MYALFVCSLHLLDEPVETCAPLPGNLGHDLQETSHDQAKPSSLKRNSKQQQENQDRAVPQDASTESVQSNDARNSKSASLTSGISENRARDVRPSGGSKSSKDNSHRQLVKEQRPKQSYGALEDSTSDSGKSAGGVSGKAGSRREQLVKEQRPKQSYGALEDSTPDSGKRAGGVSGKTVSRRDSGFRYEAGSEGSRYSVDPDTAYVVPRNTAVHGGAFSDDDADSDDIDDEAVFLPCDDTLGASDGAVSSGLSYAGSSGGINSRGDCSSNRKPNVYRAPQHHDENNDNDDDVENEINENVALVSAKQWKDKTSTLSSPSSSSTATSVSNKGGKTKAEKPQTSRKNFARLIGLYRRDINKSGKSARLSGTTSDCQPDTGRKASGGTPTQVNQVTSPKSPRTPTIQITTPSLTEDIHRSSASSPSAAPVLKSSLVRSSLSSGSGRATTSTTTTAAAAAATKSTTTTTPKHQLPNTAKHKVSFITGLRRFSREKAAFLRVDHSEPKPPKPVPTSAPTFLFPALPLADSSTGKASSSSGGSQTGTGSRRGAGGGDRRRLKVEFAVMESEVVVENSRGIRGRGRWGVMGAGGARGGEFEDGGAGGAMLSLKDDVENDVAMLGGSRARFRQARLSLLGKPLNYKAHRRDMRYRRLQSRIYNFLERPKSWGSWFYHLAM
ncbi:hypothetical protein EGW08_002833 [Elysia chlorotica]|uniref:Uncharacterized protein n=1 Tax=Elysia chlorotica TaxID=188477 RepID=A0A3S1BIX7_ELYCH|nr:hypothetical protein EGW08_002833 [Elysia chlorotica]